MSLPDGKIVSNSHIDFTLTITYNLGETYRETYVHSFGMIGIIPISIINKRPLGSWRIKGSDESTLNKDLPGPLMLHDLTDL